MMFKYAVVVEEKIPYIEYMAMSHKEKSKLLDSGDGYYSNFVDFGRFRTIKNAEIVSLFLCKGLNRVLEHEIRVEIIEVKEDFEKFIKVFESKEK